MLARFSPAQVDFYAQAIVEEDRIVGDGRDRIRLDCERLARSAERRANMYLFGPEFAYALADALRRYARREALDRAATFIQSRSDG